MEKAWQVQTKGSRCAGSLGRGGEVVDGGERQEDRLMLFSGSAWLAPQASRDPRWRLTKLSNFKNIYKTAT